METKTVFSKAFVLVLLFATIFLGCSKDNECNCPEPTPPTPPTTVPDEYYVKYTVKSSTIYLGAKMDATIRKEDSSLTTFSIAQGGTWETTIGPVEKGFNSSLTVVATNTFDKLTLDAYIHVSKNGGPFALKKNDGSDDPRDEVAINYTIDF